MTLLIAIPALNEEGSIASVIQRTLDAKAEILGRTSVTAVVFLILFRDRQPKAAAEVTV